MMKRRFCLLLAFILLLSFALPAHAGGFGGLGREKEAEEESALPASTLEERYGKANRVKGLTLALARDTYTETALSLNPMLRNGTEHAYGFGASHYLERYEDGAWRSLVPRVEINPPAIGYILQSGKRMRMPYSPGDLAGSAAASVYGPFTPGKYRILKTLERLTDDGAFAGTGDVCLLSAEFTVTPAKTLYATEPVNFRTGPGMQYEVVHELKTGEACTEVEPSGKWMQVVLADGRRGYVFAKYLTENEPAAIGRRSALRQVILNSD